MKSRVTATLAAATFLVGCGDGNNKETNDKPVVTHEGQIEHRVNPRHIAELERLAKDYCQETAFQEGATEERRPVDDLRPLLEEEYEQVATEGDPSLSEMQGKACK